MTDEQLKAMSKDEANKTLIRSDMYRWVRLHNATANLYFVKDGKIEDVEPAGNESPSTGATGRQRP